MDVIGYLNLALGVGEAGRRTLQALSRTSLVVQGLGTTLNSLSSMADIGCRQLMTETSTAPIQVFVVNTDQIAAVLDHLQDRLRQKAYRVIVPFWELARLPDEWLNPRAVIEAFKRAFRRRVRPCQRHLCSRCSTRKKYLRRRSLSAPCLKAIPM